LDDYYRWSSTNKKRNNQQKMANHKSAEKRIRANKTKQDRNRYQAKTMRNALKKIRSATDKKEAAAMMPEISSMLDKLAKNNVIHHRKAANLKSSVAKMINSLS
jgi:small subunit ribosomal protein S20